MEPWFTVTKEAVIAILERRKSGFPWGEHPEEKYRCLVFREDGVIRMTVDEFFEMEDGSYECLRFYTTFLGNTVENYQSLTEEKLASLAYGAWCSGAR